MGNILRRSYFLVAIVFLALSANETLANKEDSLRTELQQATTDTARLRLGYELLRVRRFLPPDSVIQDARELRKLATAIGDQKKIAQTLSWEGWSLDRKGMMEPALDAYRKGVAIFNTIGDVKGVVNGLVNLGSIHMQIGQPDEAAAHFDDALERAQAAGNERMIAVVKNNIAIKHAREGKFEEAEKTFQEALTYFEKINDSLEMSNALVNLGNINLKLGQHDTSINLFIRAATIDEAIGNTRGLATDYNNISHIYAEIGEYESALEYSTSAYEIYESIGNPRGMIRALNVNATFLRYMERFDEGRQLNQRALDSCRAHEITDELLALCLDGLARWEFHNERYEESLRFHEEAEKIFLVSGWESDLAILYNEMGLAYKNTGRTAKAVDYLERSAEVARNNQEVKVLMTSYFNLSELYELQGRDAKALEMMQLHEAIEDSIYQVETTEKIAEIKTKYDLEKQKRELAEEKQAREASEHESEMERSRTRLAVAIGAAVVLLLGGLIVWLRIRAKQMKELSEAREAAAEQKLLKEQAEKARLEDRLNAQALEIGNKASLLNEMRTQMEELEQKSEASGPRDYIHLFKVVEQNIRSDEEWADFKENFEQIYPSFFPNLLKTNPDLSAGERRLSVLIRMGMNQKEIANILGIHPDSVKRGRNRLRHKLGLDAAQNLKVYLCEF